MLWILIFVEIFKIDDNEQGKWLHFKNIQKNSNTVDERSACAIMNAYALFIIVVYRSRVGIYTDKKRL